MKHVGLLLASAEMLLIYFLAAYLFGARVAVVASVLALFLPPMMSRLLYAQWPTLTGHLLDVITIAFAARMVRHPSQTAPLIGYGAALLSSCLSYISSLFNMSLYTVCLALVERRRLRPLVVILSAAGISTVCLLYLPFVRVALTEILPAVLAGAPSTGSEAVGLAASLARIHLFYGFGFPLFAIGGFLLARRSPTAFRTLAAYGGTFIILLTLRAFSGAFKDLKELVFIGPFVAIGAGVSLEALAARGGSGRFAAIAVSVGLIGGGLAKFAEYARLHTQLAGLD